MKSFMKMKYTDTKSRHLKNIGIYNFSNGDNAISIFPKMWMRQLNCD